MDLFVSARLSLLDFVSFSLDARNLCVFLSLLVFVLLLQEGDTLLQMHLDRTVHLFLSCQHVAQLLNLLLQLRLFLLVEAVLARLRTLQLPLQILNVQILLNLRLVLLPLKFGHLLAVFVLLAREVILHVLVVLRRQLNVRRQLLLLLLKFLVLVRLVNLLSDVSCEGGESEVLLHLVVDGDDRLDQVVLVLAHLLLVRLNRWLLLQLTAELPRTVLQLRGDVLNQARKFLN